jgi:hypothetical protein
MKRQTPKPDTVKVFTIEHLRRVRGGADENNDQAMNSIRHIKAGWACRPGVSLGSVADRRDRRDRPLPR